MTTKQLNKLQDRISSLKASHRIVWIEGIDKDIIKGKIAGKPCYFVRAESLNADGGNWYYIVRWDVNCWRCTCDARKPCKHETAINGLLVAQYKAKKEREAARVDARIAQVQAHIAKTAPRQQEDWSDISQPLRREVAPLNGPREFSLLK